MTHTQIIPDDFDSEYLEEAKNILSYIKSYKGEIKFHREFILWNDVPEYWSGPYFKKYVLCSITDYTPQEDLKSTNLLKWEIREKAKYNIKNVPEKYKKYIDMSPRLISGKENKIHEWEKHKMNISEYRHILKIIDEKSKKQWFRNQKLEFQKEFNRDILEYPSMDYPVKVYLCGNDDTSYSILTENREKALMIVNDIRNNPTWDNLQNIGFIFTN